MQQPQRPNQQKLQVLQEAGFLAFHLVAPKLAYPGQGKNDEAGLGLTQKPGLAALIHVSCTHPKSLV